MFYLTTGDFNYVYIIQFFASLIANYKKKCCHICANDILISSLLSIKLIWDLRFPYLFGLNWHVLMYFLFFMLQVSIRWMSTEIVRVKWVRNAHSNLKSLKSSRTRHLHYYCKDDARYFFFPGEIVTAIFFELLRVRFLHSWGSLRLRESDTKTWNHPTLSSGDVL